MKIALLGYGRMGQLIDRLATQQGHATVLRIQSHNPQDLQLLPSADVAIDFSQPHTAPDLLRTCFKYQIPVVSGTTGWLQHWQTIADDCRQLNAKFFYASNFSLGVNIFFALNQYLARLTQPHHQTYQPLLTEIHHVHKLDSPSGTAKTLANDILHEWSHLDGWQLQPAQPNQLPILALRDGETVGTHKITYSSPIDTLHIEHVAHDRSGFAQGAIAAAQWLLNQTQPGIYNMKNMLQLP